jgi:hypothetical protein
VRQGRPAELRSLRVYFDEPMEVVGHDCQSGDFRPIFLCRLSKYRLTALCHRANQHSTSVFGRPDAMVLAGVDDVVVRFVPF